MSSSERHETSVTALDRLVPTPRLVEIDRLDLDAAPAAMDRGMLLGVKQRAERATVPARQVS